MSNGDTAAILSLGEEVFGDFVVSVEGLREFVDDLVVVGGVLLLISGNVSYTLGPSILGSSPGAGRLDGDVVGSTADAEETTLTPVGTPRVTDSPEFLASLGNTVTNNGDVVDNIHITGLVTEDTTSVVLELFGDGNTASDGTTLVNFLHHGFFADDGSELLSLVNVVGVGDKASLTRVAVSAVGHGGADTTVVKTATSVHGASLV